MIPEHIQREVLRLRSEEHLTHRRIAEMLPISRSSVTTIIVRGTVRLRPTTPKQIRKVIGICPQCHRWIALPCLACEKPRRPRPEWNNLPSECEYELRPKEEARRQGVLFWRVLNR